MSFFGTIQTIRIGLTTRDLNNLYEVISSFFFTSIKKNVSFHIVLFLNRRGTKSVWIPSDLDLCHFTKTYDSTIFDKDISMFDSNEGKKVLFSYTTIFRNYIGCQYERWLWLMDQVSIPLIIGIWGKKSLEEITPMSRWEISEGKLFVDPAPWQLAN